LAEHETGQIIHVDALHDDDDGAGARTAKKLKL